MTEYTKHHISQLAQQADYIARLGQADWQFEQQTWPLVAWRSVNTEIGLRQWAESQTPVEMSIVMIPPGDDIRQLPLKALGYVESAFSVVRSLRERHGLDISSLRILCPIHLNVAADGGNVETKRTNAATIYRIITEYAREFHPELHISIHLDTGNPIDETVLSQIEPTIRRLQKHDTVVGELSLAARRHSEIIGDSPEEIERRTILYLIGHGPAWGYSTPEPLFSHNGVYRPEGRIVFAPRSELRFLTLALEAGLIAVKDATKIVTLISGKQATAPYYSYFPDEPTIGDLLDGEHLEVLRARMRTKQGDPRGSDVISNLNMLLNAELQARKLRRDRTISLSNILKAIVD